MSVIIHAVRTAVKVLCNYRTGSFRRSFDYNLPQSSRDVLFARRRKICPVVKTKNACYPNRVTMRFLDLFRVGARGFEPPTPCSQGRCANQSALRPVVSSHRPIAHGSTDGNHEVLNAAGVQPRCGCETKRLRVRRQGASEVYSSVNSGSDILSLQSSAEAASMRSWARLVVCSRVPTPIRVSIRMAVFA